MARKHAGCLGLRVRTARTIAVVLRGPPDDPQVALRRELVLWDEKVPVSAQPYHAGLDVPEEEAAPIIRKATKAVQRVASREIKRLLAEIGKAGVDLHAVGLVVGSDGDPAKLRNPHVRAHALEGKLFRDVLEKTAEDHELPTLTLVEKRLYDEASELLGHSPERLKQIATELGKSVGSPWRADEKSAAIVAWTALVG